MLHEHISHTHSPAFDIPTYPIGSQEHNPPANMKVGFVANVAVTSGIRLLAAQNTLGHDYHRCLEEVWTRLEAGQIIQHDEIRRN